MAGALERAVRLASIQGIQVVIGIDNCESADTEVRREIASLGNLGQSFSARITSRRVGTTETVRAS